MKLGMEPLDALSLLRDLRLRLRNPARILRTVRANSSQHIAHGKADKWDAGGVLLDESVAAARLDLREVFGNGRPVEVEVGTGKGTFLVRRAQQRPEVNFLGIEYARAYCLYAADRMRRRGLTNVRMLHADAAGFFRTCAMECSLWRVHIYFPDPWPKRRHHRRRLIQPAFIDNVRRALKVGGELIIVTDHREYFEQIRSVLAGAAGLAIVSVPHTTGDDGELVGTNFERKYAREGRAFYTAARRKYRA